MEFEFLVAIKIPCLHLQFPKNKDSTRNKTGVALQSSQLSDLADIWTIPSGYHINSEG